MYCVNNEVARAWQRRENSYLAVRGGRHGAVPVATPRRTPPPGRGTWRHGASAHGTQAAFVFGFVDGWELGKGEGCPK